MGEHRDDVHNGAFLWLEREHWAELARTRDLELTAETLEGIRGLGDPIELDQVRQVYLPLTELINLYVEQTGSLYRQSNWFLNLRAGPTPFLIGVAGSVAVGKSTTSRLLKELLACSHPGRRVDLVTTDGFLLPNAELERRGLMDRKGFPESYDRRALLAFTMAVKSGQPVVTAPVYSHLIYDIVPGQAQEIRQPDVLIVEGLNVLQPTRPGPGGRLGLAVSDFFDFSVYVDAPDTAVKQWFLDRFRSLLRSAFTDQHSYFRQFTALPEDDAVALAERIWDTINGPNLIRNIKPTRDRARVVICKGPDHVIETVGIRRV